MEAIGAILIIAGFIMGVLGGMWLSLPHVVSDESGNLSEAKQMRVTILIVISVVMILIGQFLLTGLR